MSVVVNSEDVNWWAVGVFQLYFQNLFSKIRVKNKHSPIVFDSDPDYIAKFLLELRTERFYLDII